MIGIPGRKGRKKNNARVAMQVADSTLHLAARDAEGACLRQSLSWGDPEADINLLKDFVDTNKLQGASTSILLDLNHYQMLLVDAPPVEPAELAGALKWKVKDLLSQPLDDSIVEGFLLPEDAFRGARKMAYAAGAAKGSIQQLTSACQNLDLYVEHVGVAEISTLELIDENDDHPAIVIVIGAKGGFMSLVVGRALYLVRKFDIGHAMLASSGEAQQQALERLVLDIQRSRDYFESQMGKGVVNRLLTFPLNFSGMAIDDELNQRLGLPVEMMTPEVAELESGEQYLVQALVNSAATR